MHPTLTGLLLAGAPNSSCHRLIHRNGKTSKQPQRDRFHNTCATLSYTPTSPSWMMLRTALLTPWSSIEIGVVRISRLGWAIAELEELRLANVLCQGTTLACA